MIPCLFFWIGASNQIIKTTKHVLWEFTGKPGQENWDFWHLKKIKMTWKTKKILYILKSSVSWKDIGEHEGWGYQVFWHSKIFDMTLITKMQTIFLVFNYPKNMHIEFLCISEFAAGKMICYHFKSRQAICVLVQNDWVNIGWEFQFLVPISGTPIVSGIPILFWIPKILVKKYILNSNVWRVRKFEFRFQNSEFRYLIRKQILIPP